MLRQAKLHKAAHLKKLVPSAVDPGALVELGDQECKFL